MGWAGRAGDSARKGSTVLCLILTSPAASGAHRKPKAALPRVDELYLGMDGEAAGCAKHDRGLGLSRGAFLS